MSEENLTAGIENSAERNDKKGESNYNGLILRTEKLKKIYGSRTVVTGEDLCGKPYCLEFKQGEIVGLLGPNGAGKTTTFYMIVGMIQPNDGEVYLDSVSNGSTSIQKITRMPMYRRAQMGVGYLAQEASVFRSLSVEDNILGVMQYKEFSADEDEKDCKIALKLNLPELPAQKDGESADDYNSRVSEFRKANPNYPTRNEDEHEYDYEQRLRKFGNDWCKEFREKWAKMSKKERDKVRCDNLIKEFGLTHIRKSKGIQLSGGERRRTEIARALAINPKFIMLDEPFAGVDPIAVYDIQRIVAHLRERQIGVIISDHNVGETLAICDRAYIQVSGSLFRHGAAEELAADSEVKRVYLGKDFVLRRRSFENENDAGDKENVANYKGASAGNGQQPVPAKEEE